MSHCHCLAENLVKPTERSVYNATSCFLQETGQNWNLSHWWVYVLYAAALNKKTATVGRDDGVHGAEHCGGYIGDSLSVASAVSEQTCYPTLLSYSSDLSSCYDHSPQSDSVTYLQQVR